MAGIKILVVDEYALFRSGVATLLQQQTDLEVIGEARNGVEALQLASDLQPDVILMDVHMPEMDGLEATRRLKAMLPAIRIVLFTLRENDTDLFEILRAGADGYLPKQIEPAGLCRALRGVVQGQVAISRHTATRLFVGVAQLLQEEAEKPPHQAPPSPREQEVLALLTTGASNREIAGQLGISVHTVKTHLKNILMKLGLENRVQAATYVLNNRQVWTGKDLTESACTGVGGMDSYSG